MRLVLLVEWEWAKRTDGDELRRLLSSAVAAVSARKSQPEILPERQQGPSRSTETGGNRKPVALSKDEWDSQLEPQPEWSVEDVRWPQPFNGDSSVRKGAAAEDFDQRENHEHEGDRYDRPTLPDLERERIVAIPRPSPLEPKLAPPPDAQLTRMLGDTICTVPEYFRTVHRVKRVT
jgi:hypothetical protein